VTSAPSDSVPAGSPFSFAVTTSGSPSPKITEKGKLPKGVKFHKGTGTASISGKATKTGTFHIIVKATFGKGKTQDVVTQDFTLTVT
jgi:hypothetical protein